MSIYLTKLSSQSHSHIVLTDSSRMAMYFNAKVRIQKYLNKIHLILASFCSASSSQPAVFHDTLTLKVPINKAMHYEQHGATHPVNHMFMYLCFFRREFSPPKKDKTLNVAYLKIEPCSWVQHVEVKSIYWFDGKMWPPRNFDPNISHQVVVLTLGRTSLNRTAPGHL